ncbi:hypothetical protein [Streptomyces sp. AM6-12]|uniref:hypothetical protein n=1 Tax=Streptomyces sp. AM6-12 TaxID=3345149 RepID=UPI003798B5ED
MTTSSQQVIWRPLSKERGSSRRRRRLAAAVAAPVALVAVIALTARGGADSGQVPVIAGRVAAPQMTHSRQGAETTGLKVALAFGSEAMFVPAQRHELLRSITEPDQLAQMTRTYDAAYGPFTKRLGLDAEGNPPPGGQFTSRAAPAGVTVRTYTGTTAVIDYWCATLFGLTGTHGKDVPLKQAWLTARVTLHWTNYGWRLAAYSQSDGPTPEDSDGRFGAAPQL